MKVVASVPSMVILLMEYIWLRKEGRTLWK